MIIPYDKSSVQRAAEIVWRGGVIAFRTDTFYGLGANPFDRGAVTRIKELKGREEAKPVLIVISDRDQVPHFIEQPTREFERLAERFWPGPLTLIGTARSHVPQEVTAGTGTVGIRLPDDEDVRSLLRACGGCLTATSANLAGQPPTKTAAEVANYFPEGIDLIIDGGLVRTDQPSTVLDLSGGEAKLIREGAIPMSEIQHRASYKDLRTVREADERK